MTRKMSLMAAYAHPDDEILAPGGTIAKLAARGVRVTLVCTTRGEAGEIASPELATPENLGAVREQELRCSAAALGIAEVILMDYRDSGMAGTPENEHPRAYMNAPAPEVIEQLVRIMRRVKPSVVITFEPNGGYGHPDHIAINQHTLAAFHAAGDAQLYPDAGEAWQPARLCYPVLPVLFWEEMRAAIAAHGGKVEDINLDRLRENGWPDEKIHIFCNVEEEVPAKFAAWSCHRTQFGPNSRFRRLPRAEMMKLLSREYFAIAQPKPEAGTRLTDLLAGL